MQLDRIELEGWKSIRQMDLALRQINLLVGANGSGKSNLLAAFGLLSELVNERLQASVAAAGGTSTLLHYGPKTTERLRLALHFGENGYEAILSAAAGDSLFFEKERCWFEGHGESWQLRPPPSSNPFDIALGGGQRETLLPWAASQPNDRVARPILETLRSWKIFHFHDTSRFAKTKLKGKLDDNASLRADASNLAAFLYRLRATDEPAYRRIVTTIQQVAPFFREFELSPDPVRPDLIQLAWSEKASDAYFDANAFSDGTLRFACLATLLLQPSLPSLVLIDEPELGLHPYAITLLAAMLRSAATKTQLIVATQSVTLVNQFEAEDVVVVDRDGGQSTFRRLLPADIEAWKDGYALGDLWEKNVLGGRPQRP